MQVIAYPQTHWDREWYQPYEEFRLRLIEVVDSLIEDLKSGKLNYFYFDGQTIALEDYFELFPDRKEEIKVLIKQDKLSVGPWYVLADEFLVSGESLIRNLLLGIKQSQELGCNEFIGYLPDAFGHCSNMPRIFNLFDIKNAIIWRGAGENKSEFLWQSEERSEVLATYLIEGYFQDILNWNEPQGKKIKSLIKFLNKIKKYNLGDTILLPCGGDHLAAAKDFEKQITDINNKIPDFNIKTGSIFEYLKAKKNLKGLKKIKNELRDNSRNFILPSTSSSRIYLKQQNAIATWKLASQAEPLQSQLQVLGMTKPRDAQIKQAWKILLQNHPHDSICGCSVDAVHNEMETRYCKINQITDGVANRALFDIAKLIPEGDLVIYNASNFNYKGVLKIQTPNKLPKALRKQYLGKVSKFPQKILLDIQRPPFQEDIEEFNEYLIYLEDLRPNSLNILGHDYKYQNPANSVKCSNNSISNDKIEVEVANDKVVNFFDKQSGKFFENFITITDMADVGDTYNFAPLKKDMPIYAKLKEYKIAEKGDLISTIKLSYTINIPEKLIDNNSKRSKKKISHNLELYLSIFAESNRLEAELIWENKSLNHILQVKFNTGQKVFKTFSEDNFGITERSFDPNYSLKSTMPARKNEELKVNIAPMQRFVWANNLGVITEGLHEYGVDDKELYITALRSVGKLSNGSLATRGTPAGPPLDVPGAQCLGDCKVKFAICASNEPTELFRQADEFMGALIYDIGINEKISAQSNSKQLLSFDSDKIYLYAKKLSENDKGSLVIRALNLTNETVKTSIQTDFQFKYYVETNALEKPIAEKYSINKSLGFKPNELKTILISNH